MSLSLSSKPELAAYCRTHGIRRLSLFGSRAKGMAHSDSDVDVLVEFIPGEEPGLFGLATMEAELSLLMNNLKVDLRTPGDLSRYFREQVMSEALPQYVA